MNAGEQMQYYIKLKDLKELNFFWFKVETV